VIPHPMADQGQSALVAHMAERADRSRKRGRKRVPQDNRVLPRTAEQLIRRIVRATADGTGTWAEANNEVARALHVDRSTANWWHLGVREDSLRDRLVATWGQSRKAG
jgi:hypothetical protein